MTVSKSQQESVNRYIKKHYDKINLTMEKGKKEIIKEYAEKQNESVNQFINTAINERIEKLESASATEEREKAPKNIV